MTDILDKMFAHDPIQAIKYLKTMYEAYKEDDNLDSFLISVEKIIETKKEK